MSGRSQVERNIQCQEFELSDGELVKVAKQKSQDRSCLGLLGNQKPFLGQHF